MISISDDVTLDESELKFDAIQASGPGGQNVNKVATAIQLRFDAVNSPSLPADICQRLLRLAGKRRTAGGQLLIRASRYRTQEQNRQDALERLIILLRKASEKPKIRRKTCPSHASRKRRLEDKRRRSETKRLRRRIDG